MKTTTQVWKTSFGSILWYSSSVQGRLEFLLLYTVYKADNKEVFIINKIIVEIQTVIANCAEHDTDTNL